MAAELDLIPKVPVLAVQAGIFLTNVLLIKNLFVTPYLRVREDREKNTLGHRDDAQKMAADFKDLADEIDRNLSKGMQEIRQSREARRQAALEKRQKLIDDATLECRQHIARAEVELQEQLKSELSRIPDVVKNVSELAFKAIV